MSLPAGLTSRALVPTDAQAVFEVVAAAEEHELGEAAIDLEDIEGDWQRPSFDLATESIGVFEGERLVGTAEVFRGRRAEAAVHPSAHGRGIGTWLAAWTEHTARERGGTLVGQSVPDGSGGERLLKARGYRCLWNSWVLEVPADATITPQPLPEGYLLRDFTPQADDHTAYTLIEDAFGEWPDRTPSTFDDWAARAVNRPGFEPWQIRLAQDRTATRSASPTRSSPATAATSTSWRCDATSAAAGSPGPCSSTRSSGPARAAPRAASWPPTRGPGRCPCTSTSGWS
jgi:GNAT superfamily N-acetyltransferase